MGILPTREELEKKCLYHRDGKCQYFKVKDAEATREPPCVLCYAWETNDSDLVARFPPDDAGYEFVKLYVLLEREPELWNLMPGSQRVTYGDPVQTSTPAAPDEPESFAPTKKKSVLEEWGLK